MGHLKPGLATTWGELVLVSLFLPNSLLRTSRFHWLNRIYIYNILYIYIYANICLSKNRPHNSLRMASLWVPMPPKKMKGPLVHPGVFGVDDFRPKGWAYQQNGYNNINNSYSNSRYSNYSMWFTSHMYNHCIITIVQSIVQSIWSWKILE